MYFIYSEQTCHNYYYYCSQVKHCSIIKNTRNFTTQNGAEALTNISANVKSCCCHSYSSWWDTLYACGLQ